MAEGWLASTRTARSGNGGLHSLGPAEGRCETDQGYEDTPQRKASATLLQLVLQ